MTRTFDPLQTGDLQEIRAYELDELERFLYQAGNLPGKFAHYQDRLIAICLCQGFVPRHDLCAPALAD
jgi:hypothetical protein